jgi:exodeoxyribonuclease V alpha subunit
VRPLSILTGGPGTGKTTLVARLVRLLALHGLEQNRRAPRVLLLAPTGKAAAAMASSFAQERSRAGLTEEVRAALPTGAETIHRALAAEPGGGSRPMGRIRGGRVVVDEVSMVDLEPMARLAACELVPRLAPPIAPARVGRGGAVLADSAATRGSAPVAD